MKIGNPPMNIRCVTYQDKFSADKSALKDLMIGYEHHVVGCGSKVFAASNEGDLVVINAADKSGVRHAVIGRLVKKLDECDKWSAEGGLDWPYNWTYAPLTSIFQYDEGLQREMKVFCEGHSLKHKNLFHSRFCSNKLWFAIEYLIAKFRS